MNFQEFLHCFYFRFMVAGQAYHIAVERSSSSAFCCRWIFRYTVDVDVDDDVVVVVVAVVVEGVVTDYTLHMTLHVQRQMVGAWETTITVATFERFRPCMFAIMAGQFITAGKSPLTTLPRAFVGFFAWKYSKNEKQY